MTNSVVLGYDPGGNQSHGVAAVILSSNRIVEVTTETCGTAAEALSWLEDHTNIIAVGVDTLAAWSLGLSGWRAADKWLRRRYTECYASVVSPNGLYGSMGINGMAVLCSLAERIENLAICETHPKVLYFALHGEKYDYASNCTEMDRRLSNWMGYAINTRNDHEWDAAVSAFAAFQGLRGNWTNDLFALSDQGDERLVRPCGNSNYWWPE